VGRFRIEWSAGAGHVGTILASSSRGVRRALLDVQGAPPRPGTRARFAPDFRGDPGSALGLAFDEVDIPGPAGRLPVWVVPGSRPTWVLLIHGYGGTRQSELYSLPAIHASGFGAMVVAYRNDPGAGRAPHGYTHLGQTEWRDIDAEIGWALSHGARDVVLDGASMGGAIALEEARHGSYRAAIRGVVLDSPALDFGQDIHYAGRDRASGPVGWWVIASGEWAMRMRAGIQFGDLDQIAHARELRPPILLLQGDRDRATPVSGADTFARVRPDLVTYVRVSGAGHVAAWNVDRARYEAALTTFLERVAGGGPPPASS
jgi:alpha-beta hydrolase superfamily lysophospholipase